ncbi:conserved hypothetical protein [Candida tropicalis MYA-3404]|uniref:Uncharacterized protein n=1 Tax=Candida tropicalis (strain ATCC MYA-3404 / T1) TaxID=294747 RepID=C5MHC2_CANTT|nr:conserved hypothetical protein [Candida tropicalis MYA-3404]EER31024.1 conserved hypothetical protein [Candida tropicalis MYA-3404]KAG4404585.1 hypothetical protein JTP64_006338 [Candida tropicalis]
MWLGCSIGAGRNEVMHQGKTLLYYDGIGITARLCPTIHAYIIRHSKKFSSSMLSPIGISIILTTDTAFTNFGESESKESIINTSVTIITNASISQRADCIKVHTAFHCQHRTTRSALRESFPCSSDLPNKLRI